MELQDVEFRYPARQNAVVFDGLNLSIQVTLRFGRYYSIQSVFISAYSFYQCPYVDTTTVYI